MLFLVIVIMFFRYQTCNAQINQRLKGYRIQMDTAVVMDLKTYRDVRGKIYAADSAIFHLESRVINQSKLIDLLENETRNLLAQADLQSNFIEQSQVKLNEINRTVKEIKNAPTEKLPFYKQDWFLAVVVGLAVLGLAN